MAREKKSKTSGGQKDSASKRTANPPGQDGVVPENVHSKPADQEQDEERRLGNFGGKGEHVRTGRRGQ